MHLCTIRRIKAFYLFIWAISNFLMMFTAFSHSLIPLAAIVQSYQRRWFECEWNECEKMIFDTLWTYSVSLFFFLEGFYHLCAKWSIQSFGMWIITHWVMKRSADQILVEIKFWFSYYYYYLVLLQICENWLLSTSFVLNFLLKFIMYEIWLVLN